MGLFDQSKEKSEQLLEQEAVAVVPILSESLTVHKTLADAGGVRIHKKVREETIDVDEPLLRQSVQVTRVPIGREVADALPIRHEGDVTIIPIVEERLVLRRQLFLVEEVRLTRVERVDRASQRVSLRHEEAVIERQDVASGTWHLDDASLLRT